MRSSFGRAGSITRSTSLSTCGTRRRNRRRDPAFPRPLVLDHPGRAARRARPRPHLAPGAARPRSDRRRARDDDRRRDLYDDRSGRTKGRTRHHRRVFARRFGIALRGTRLRGTRGDGTGGRERVYLRVSAAPVAQQFSASLQDALRGCGIVLPHWAQTAHLAITSSWIDWSHTQIDLIGASFVLVLSALLALGISETAISNNVFVVVKIGALVVFVIAGLSLFHPQNLAPFAPLGWGKLSFGASGNGIIPAAALVFFTYIGF